MKLSKLLTILLMTLSVNSVMADEVLISSSNNVSGKVTQIGVNYGNLPIIKGYAKDIPLIDVLKQIIPNGWVVKKNDTPVPLNIKKNVSWNGGKSWVEILGVIASKYSLDVKINWEKKEILVEEANKEKESSVMSEDNESKFEVNEKKQNSEKVKAVSTKAWRLKLGKLSDSVVEWGKTAGYDVVWRGADYTIDKERLYTGDFDAENGPVDKIAKDYGPKSRVEEPLTFNFFENKVLVVETLRYDQSGVVQERNR